MSEQKPQLALYSLSAFVSQKFKDEPRDTRNKFLVISLFLDELGNPGLSATAKELWDAFQETDTHTFHALTLNDFSIFINNSFISQFLYNKVIALQKPKIREMLMRMSDGENPTHNDLKMIETLNNIVSKNENSHSDIIYIYTKTPSRGDNRDAIDKVLKKHTKETF